MRNRVARTLFAGILAFGAAALVIGPALAQAESGTPGPAAPEDAQAERDAGPSLPRPGQVPEGDSQAGSDQPDLQQGCPDQRRPLQLIV